MRWGVDKAQRGWLARSIYQTAMRDGDAKQSFHRRRRWHFSNDVLPLDSNCGVRRAQKTMPQ
eukprot:9018632-Pyramimonas_sp.AAC.1